MHFGDGTFWREKSRRTVWLVYDGVRYGVPSQDVFENAGWSWGDVRVVPDGTLDQVPKIPPDGTVLRDKSGRRVFRMCSGYRLEFVGPEADSVDHLRGWILPDEMIDVFPSAGGYKQPRHPLWLRVRAFQIRHARLLDRLLWLVLGAALTTVLRAWLG